MRWLHRLKDSVSSQLRNSAGRYASRVRIEYGTNAECRAEVHADSPYSVDLYMDDNALVTYCNCATFSQRLLCSHIWAALMAAESAGHLSRIASTWGPFIRLESDEEHGRRPGRPSRPPAPEPWQLELSALRKEIVSSAAVYLEPQRRIFYTIDADECVSSGGLIVHVEMSRLKKDGSWGKPNRRESPIRCVSQLEEADRKLLSILGSDASPYTTYLPDKDSIAAPRRIPRDAFDLLMPMLCGTGRFLLEPAELPDSFQPLQWDGGEVWALDVAIRKNEEMQAFVMRGSLKRNNEQRALQEAKLMIPGLVFFEDRVAHLKEGRGLQWAARLRKSGDLAVPFTKRQEFMMELAQFPVLPSIDFPEEIQIDRGAVEHPILKISKPKYGNPSKLKCEVRFGYGSVTVAERHPAAILHDKATDRLVARDSEGERKAMEQLFLAGARRTSMYSVGGGQLELSASRLPGLVRKLVPEGWRVEAEGNLYRKAGQFRFEVTSGIDWFELSGHAEFDGERIELPELLKAVARGDSMVRLGDGSFGVLPEEWLKRYRLVSSMGSRENGALRFRTNQASMLDALLASQPEVTFDESFQRIRQELENFGGIQPADPSPGFSGTLRDYQREGLAWLRFLRKFRFGGCLADDMGLGKTIQVLALLDGEGQGPVLVVVPRSLVFNWKQEAARFAPRLRVLDLTGPGRMQSLSRILECDLVLSTYGTLRRDAPALKDVVFDTIILDEAQSIKNSETASAKAAMLMTATHRLALTGTPIENHLGDLWSILEFLNPGLLGAASVFRAHSGAGVGTESLQLIAKALRPFILRRTKKQVARELPEKTEQVIYCELEGAQRKLYNELRDHYRASLLGRIDELGLQESRMQIFEALLRLRQAACHPGLIDKKRLEEPSSKLESLIEQLTEVVSEGHKVLVFSQFTSLLAIVKKKLDAVNLVYEYLDGKTRDRQACVRRFQDDEACPIFLISLKAGGLGLNLTTAEYVFLLDPWWNPAVEAQAIDRTHRIGQTERVFAYRLIAKDTVEEKVLELQKSKRGLAEAVINEDNSLLASLDRETIAILLS